MRTHSSLSRNTRLRARMSWSSLGLAMAHGECGASRRYNSSILTPSISCTWSTGCKRHPTGVANTVEPMVSPVG